VDKSAVTTPTIASSPQPTRTLLTVARALFLLEIAALFAAPILTIGPSPPAVVGPASQIDLPEGGSASVPRAWQWTYSPASYHSVVALAASNNPEAIKGLVVATLRRLSVRSIGLEKLSHDDAFVQVWNTNILTSEPTTAQCTTSPPVT
jgi:hypothetical protein